MILRHFKGDVTELSLTFTVTDSLYGQNTEVEIKPGRWGLGGLWGEEEGGCEEGLGVGGQQ